MKIPPFIDLVEHTIPDLLDQNGSVLYSHPRTIQKGEFYLMGLNPGGSHETSIRDRLARPESDLKNEYTEVVWTGDQPGDHQYQKNLIWLFEQLGVELNDVCATNLIFVRSRNADSLTDYEDLAKQCWPLHCELLNIVQPSIILAVGTGDTSPIHFLYEQSEESPRDWEEFDSGHGDWKCKSFVGVYEGRATRVIGLPHLSRYSVIGKMDVVKWIQSLRSSATNTA